LRSALGFKAETRSKSSLHFTATKYLISNYLRKLAMDFAIGHPASLGGDPVNR
jgi:hypothetical protein